MIVFIVKFDYSIQRSMYSIMVFDYSITEKCVVLLIVIWIVLFGIVICDCVFLFCIVIP